MERIGFLINKLKEQYEKADPQQSLLVTLQMLYRELQPKINGDDLLGNVSIVVPGQMDLSFLDKNLEQKMALDLPQNTEGKQVFELSVNPTDEKTEPSDNSQLSIVNSQLEPTINSQLSISNSQLEPTISTAPSVQHFIQEVKRGVSFLDPEKQIIKPEAIAINDKFSEPETLNSRFTIPEKDDLPTVNDKIENLEESHDSRFKTHEKDVPSTTIEQDSRLTTHDSRFMPPTSKPEPPPVEEPPIVEVPIFTKPPTVIATVLPVKEIHETISVTTFTSYNDKQEKRQPEFFNSLKAEPLKDLKKAISINDRFQYVSHLFMGDETVYERSIKTINHFNVYSEAEFWIRRELSTKMGWNKDDSVVQQFMGLVQRRFA